MKINTPKVVLLVLSGFALILLGIYFVFWLLCNLSSCSLSYTGLEYQDGFITIPDKPGLGIEIDEEACLAHPYQPHTLRHYTGALTDIRPAKTEFYF